MFLGGARPRPAEAFCYVPCLKDDPAHLAALAALVERAQPHDPI